MIPISTRVISADKSKKSDLGRIRTCVIQHMTYSPETYHLPTEASAPELTGHVSSVGPTLHIESLGSQ